jgi:hypothetical protein
MNNPSKKFAFYHQTTACDEFQPAESLKPELNQEQDSCQIKLV